MQVSSISFFEHHTIEGHPQGSEPAVTAQTIWRSCVMETEVTNRTEGPLQVGHKTPSSARDRIECLPVHGGRCNSLVAVIM